jgi:hypothetical protein
LINVLDFGADPEGKEDCTLSIVQATERAMGIGGGVVYFPAGRYRIDSILRSGMYIRHPLRVPRGVTLRGAGADLVSLWWPDQAEPLPSLIEGGDDFAIEDLSLYTQGRHRNIISGESGVKVRRVRIRANCYYMTGDQGRPHHLRSVDESPSAMGFAVELSGDNNEVTDCDIYTSNACFSIKHCHHAVVARNTVRASNLVFISGGSEIVFERNTFEGNRLAAGGNNIALHFGASDCRHVYYAHNTVAHIYGGDHEALTFDGHGTAYLGRVKDSEPGAFTLLAPAVTGTGERDAMATLHDATAYILAGRGAGQYRRVRSVIGERVTLEEPWLVAPDATSILSIGGFNGRHLIIGNTAQDTGAAVQLYPPNCECIVAENRAIHASNINIVGKLGINTGSRFPRAEASWYNQILDNHVVHGNGWGGGETEIDRWLGGECMLNIWGWEVQFYCDEHGSDQDKYLSHADLASLPGGAGKEAVAVPISRAHVVRRHLIDNNSSIRVRGAATDVLIEHCRIADSARGVRIDDELPQEHDPGLNQLRTTKETVRRSGSDPYLTPKGVLVRGTQFTNVNLPLSGTALPDATVLD